jgi:hypothetical protein
VPTELAVRDVRKFVENLHTYNAALGNQRLSSRTSWIIGSEGIDQSLMEDPDKRVSIGVWEWPLWCSH